MATSTPSPSEIATPRPLSDLQPDSDLLHLLFHRNKNQHRSAKWWKWFGMLRRNIRKLLHPEEGEAEAENIGKRVEYMRRVLVPSCYSAFTSVIADTQFAPLGLALLGVLARVHAIVGPETPVPEAKKVKAKGKGKEVVEVVVRDTASYREKGAIMELDNDGEDFGEAIVRREELAGEEEEEVVVGKQEIAVGGEEDTGVQEAEEVGVGEGVSEHEAPVIPLPSAVQTVEPDIVVAAIKDPKRGEKNAKKKKKAAKLTASSSRVPSPPPPLPPPTGEERQKKAKRKAGEKEGAKKKKKRKKADEIDDLFAGLL